ncbi:hypothetical protein SPRG_11592 [Saprolegnia parasitica CBS 223.65]|uniref:Uncharacterized protein n=1 Tax=Saprolegnia parasitica (strain CBS 223.65) TaxID=695850 RepID=A0A067BX42_SAPPC|nr:hypothetical protein SPRG_11592 [Saprolegnia parasitica CBS 223.65]KDO22833.1 hypothetical protein SPRG_11592 [Saprolegnia parasitica CBS 223.65]|eukprot:XP_012206504.1 hypothetical protein SPRG_11592 [Saprolegnia parasitica CBS 223.65]
MSVLPFVLLALAGVCVAGIIVYTCIHKPEDEWRERTEPLMATCAVEAPIAVRITLPQETSSTMEAAHSQAPSRCCTCKGCGATIDPSLLDLANGLCVACSYQSIRVPSLEIDMPNDDDEEVDTTGDVHSYRDTNEDELVSYYYKSEQPPTTDEGTTAEMESPQDDFDFDQGAPRLTKDSLLEPYLEIDVDALSQDGDGPLEDAHDGEHNDVADEDAEIAEEALSLIQDMWDIAYQAHLGVHDPEVADAFAAMALDLDATADAIQKEPHLLSESFHFLSQSLASLLELVPDEWSSHVEATELKFEALQFRYHSKLTVECCLDLVSHLYELVECARSFGVDADVAASLLEGLEELAAAVEETPCELVSWLSYLTATVKLLKAYEHDFAQAAMWDNVVECERNLEPLQMHCWEIYSPC